MAATSDRSVSRSERVRANDPFEGYSILKPEEQARFLPQSSNRPNLVIAGILLLFLIGLVVTLYSYHRWGQSPPASEVRTNSNQQTQTPAGPQNKPRSTPSNVGEVSPPAGELSRENGAAVQSEPDAKTPTKERTAFRIDSVNLDVQPVTPLAPRGQLSEITPRVNVPNMRLPRADLKENDPAPSFPHLPAYGQPEVVMERQVLRTPDGTQVVKFSDGTTRVFRPGEKIASGSAPQ